MDIAAHSFPNVNVDAAMRHGEHVSVPATIRYVLADDDFLARRGVEAVLEPEAHLHLVGTCSGPEALPALVAATGPAVVVTNAWRPPDGEGGLEFACGLRDHVPRIGLVVLSRCVDSTYGAALLESGLDSRAYLLKERVAEPGRLADAICEVSAGRSVVDPKVVDGVFDARRPPAGSPIDELTSREREALALIATGKSNGAIAAEL